MKRPRRLTRKQHHYLRELAAGRSTDEIGRAAGADRTSVADTIARIRRRLGARHNAHMVTIAVVLGLLDGATFIGAVEQGGHA